MIGWCRVFGFALMLCGAVLPAAADEFRPAYLQLTQIDASTYDVLWKLPALDEATTLRLRPEFPPGTRVLTPVRSSYAAGTAVQRWRIQVDSGLAGQAVRFPELAATRIDVLVRLARRTTPVCASTRAHSCFTSCVPRTSASSLAYSQTVVSTPRTVPCSQ